MTHQIGPDLLTTVLQLLTDEGSAGFAEGLRLLVNEAMVQERSAVLHGSQKEKRLASTPSIFYLSAGSQPYRVLTI